MKWHYFRLLFMCFERSLHHFVNTYLCLQAVVERTGVNPAEVGDIVIGSVLAPGAQRANECRMAAFFAGFPGRNLTSIALCPLEVYRYGVANQSFPSLRILLEAQLLIVVFVRWNRDRARENREQAVLIWIASCC